jgi:hypothetical protein
MPSHVVNGALLACTFGAAPSTLQVPMRNKTQIENQQAATIMDHLPNTNIMPFGMCMSPANPQVAAATAAALGVLTPQPCQPATMSPWVPGSPTTSIGSEPVLDDTCSCMCLWAGVVTITMPGTVQRAVP